MHEPSHQPFMYSSSRRGQVWSTDLAVGMFVFIIAMTIAFTLITNMRSDDAYVSVQSQAKETAMLLAQEGYPSAWSGTTIIKLGLANEGVLSLRKTRELASLSTAALHASSRASDNIAIYITNASNATIGIMGVCGVGDVTPVVTNQSNATLATAILINPAGDHTWSDTLALQMKNVYNITINLSSYAVVTPVITQYDVIVLDAMPLNASIASEAATLLNEYAHRGVTFVVIGNPGATLLGIQVNSTNTTNASVVADAPQIGLVDGSTMIMSGTIDTINTPSDPAVSGYQPIALSSAGKPIIATWLYADSRVLYIGAINGTIQGGGTIAATTASNFTSSISVSWPSCAAISLPATATQVVSYDRILPWHDQMLHVHSVVWRSS